MNTWVHDLLKNYQDLELQAHASLDDVLAKATQETAELAQALETADASLIQGEAADLVANVLSASARMGALPENFAPTEEIGAASVGRLLALLGKWNGSLQALRGRYSRDIATIEELTTITRAFVSAVLVHAAEWQTIASIIQGNTDKLAKRIDAYKPQLDLNHYVRNCPDFPKQGILFRDIAPMLASPEAMRYVTFELAYLCRWADVITGLDARGFLFGMAVAKLLEKPFVMIRKKWKLPGTTIAQSYDLEYGSNAIEVQTDVGISGKQVAIIDDLIATGGTLAAAAELIERSGGTVNAIASVISLDEAFLRDQAARKVLARYNTQSVLHYDE